MFQTVSLFLVCFLATALAGTQKEHLLRDLMDGYDANVDPGKIKLNLNVMLRCASLDDNTGIVSAHVWEPHAWKDPRLVWIPSEYGGLDTLRIPARLVWTPDTIQFKQMTAKTYREDINVVLKSDGSIIWVPRADYRVHCTGESEISCEWRIGSWSYDGYGIELESQGELLDLSVYLDSCPLRVVRHKAEIVTHQYAAPFPSLDATIVFKKNHSTP